MKNLISTITIFEDDFDPNHNENRMVLPLFLKWLEEFNQDWKLEYSGDTYGLFSAYKSAWLEGLSSGKMS